MDLSQFADEVTSDGPPARSPSPFDDEPDAEGPALDEDTAGVVAKWETSAQYDDLNDTVAPPKRSHKKKPLGE